MGPTDERGRYQHPRCARRAPGARGRAAAHRRPVGRRRRGPGRGLRRPGLAGLGRARAHGPCRTARADPGPGLAALSAYPDALRDEVERYLAALRFPSAAPQTDGLEEAMRYSLLAGGKRIRPVLALATARAIGREPAGV